MPDRIYTEEEVAAIFARAAESQRSRSRRDSVAGLTLEEIQRAGTEAGLDAAAIRAAANDLEIQQQFPKHPRITVAERWVDGDLPAGAWEDVVASLRHQLGTSSAWWSKDTASLGDAREWTHTSASGVKTTVTLSPRNDRTLLRVVQEESGLDNERWMGWLVAAFLGLVPAVLTGGLVAETFGHGDFVGVAAMLMVFMAAVAVGGPLVSARVRSGRERRRERVHEIADGIFDRVQTMQSESGARQRVDSIEEGDVATPEITIPESEDVEPSPQSGRYRARS